MKTQFNYVIGYQYEDGGICTYMFHCQDVFHGALEEAEDTLNVVMCEMCESKRDVEWKIFVLSELDVPQETL
jgi:hypothetical protein